jgi:hypothetical protein
LAASDVFWHRLCVFQVIPAMCFPLNDILDVIGVNHIDYLSLDIEGPELQVLEAIDWKRIRIDIMTVEIHGDMKKLNDSRQLMRRIGGYREVGLKGLDVVYPAVVMKIFFSFSFYLVLSHSFLFLFSYLYF